MWVRAGEPWSGDPELRSLAPAFRIGLLTTYGIVAAGGAYILTTWDGDNRGWIAALFALGALSGIAIALMPQDRVIASRWRWHFFFGWTVADIVLVALVASLDGGVASPFAALLFLPQIFAALFYPLRLTVFVCGLTLIALAAVALLGGGAGEHAWFLGACLVGAALMAAYQARHSEILRHELAVASRTDPLTGSLNRRGLEQRLEQEVARAHRENAVLGLCVLDLDGFKAINDHHGHPAGDEVLRQTVDAITTTVRTMDSVGRLGGDEFAVICPGAGPALMLGVRDRIESVVNPLVRCSIGVACFPDDGADADGLLLEADRRMYAHKAAHARGDFGHASPHNPARAR